MTRRADALADRLEQGANDLADWPPTSPTPSGGSA